MTGSSGEAGAPDEEEEDGDAFGSPGPPLDDELSPPVSPEPPHAATAAITPSQAATLMTYDEAHLMPHGGRHRGPGNKADHVLSRAERIGKSRQNPIRG